MAIKKTFPADTAKRTEYQTFLNDQKVDAELYALLLSYSYGVSGNEDHGPETRVDKKDFPTQQQIADMLYKQRVDSKTGEIKTADRRTVMRHLAYLKDKGYLIDKGDYYQILQKEKMYFQMPLELVNFFISYVKPLVLKTYIYLGQRYNYKHNYEFTIKEIAEHLGLNYQSNHKLIRGTIDILIDLELIQIQLVSLPGGLSRMKIVNLSFEPKRHQSVNASL